MKWFRDIQIIKTIERLCNTIYYAQAIVYSSVYPLKVIQTLYFVCIRVGLKWDNYYHTLLFSLNEWRVPENVVNK